MDELADMYDAEKRISKALPQMAEAASSTELQNALLNHQKETLGQIGNLEKVFAIFDEKPKAKKCKATVGLLAEGDEIAQENEGKASINAGIISACQKVEHYEIASYGCLVNWANVLGKTEAASIFEQILEEEKAANETLTELSSKANQEANEGSEEDGANLAGGLEEGSLRTPQKRTSQFGQKI